MTRAAKTMLASSSAVCLLMTGCQASRGYIDWPALFCACGLLALMAALIEMTRAVRR